MDSLTQLILKPSRSSTLRNTRNTAIHFLILSILPALFLSCSSSGSSTPTTVTGIDISSLCRLPVAPDTTSPTQVVGDGTSASCTEQAFKNAIAQGGVITFNCGTDPLTITLTSVANINSNTDTIIDGNDLITLHGGLATRILQLQTGNFESTSPTLTVMNLTFRNATSTGSYRYNDDGDYLGYNEDAGGGAIHYYGGNVSAFDCTFINNHCPDWGPDLAGGGIYGIGDGRTIIADSHFEDNTCANGGAVGGLHTSIMIYNTTITNNQALGKGANYEDENDVQQGHGGNGGGVQMDGDEQDFLLCNSTISSNVANSLGGGIFRTTYNGTGNMVIYQSSIEDNNVTDKDDPDDWDESSNGGGIYFQGGPIVIADTTITRNSAHTFGGLQLAFDQTTMSFDNVNITYNVARLGLAGGIWIAEGITGIIKNSSISYNSAPGPGSFAAASAGGGEPSVVLSNTRILHNTAGNYWNPMSCRYPFIEGGGNYQYPVIRPNGESDYPDYLCSAFITISDPTN